MALPWRLGGRLRDPLRCALNDDEALVRVEAAEGLGSADATILETLGAALNHSDREVRCKATGALAGLEDIRTVDLLRRALGDGEYDVRRVAAVGLHRLGDEGVGPLADALSEAVRKGDKKFGYMLEGVLGSWDCRAIYSTMSRHVNPQVRQAADEWLQLQEEAESRERRGRPDYADDWRDY